LRQIGTPAERADASGGRHAGARSGLAHSGWGRSAGRTVAPLADRVGDDGHVVGADIGTQGLLASHERLRHRRQVSPIQADAATLDQPAHNLDAVFSRSGPALEDAPHLGFADPGTIRASLQVAGSDRVEITLSDAQVSGGVASTLAVVTRAGRLGCILRDRPDRRRDADERVGAMLRKRKAEGRVSLAAETTQRRPDRTGAACPCQAPQLTSISLRSQSSRARSGSIA
jgi:hypothetical protein